MRRSALALVGSLIGLAYLGLVAFALARMWDFGAFSIRVLGYEVQIARLLPFLIAAGLADLSGWIGYFLKKRVLSLAAALLYGLVAPILPALVYASAALAAFSLADFLFYPALTSKREKPAPGSAEQDSADTLPADNFDAALPDDESLTLDSQESPDEPEDGMDVQNETGAEDESPAWLDDDEAAEESPRERSPADGTGIFLSLFTIFTIIVLIGVVAYGLIAGKLPFMP